MTLKNNGKSKSQKYKVESKIKCPYCNKVNKNIQDDDYYVYGENIVVYICQHCYEEFTSDTSSKINSGKKKK